MLLLLLAFVSSCGIGQHAYVVSYNQNATQIHLRGNNFKVINQVSGSSEVSYAFAVGGKEEKQLYENAYPAMMKKANLMNGSSIAIINVIKKEHFSGFAHLFVKRTITVSTQVVEFTR
jgi:hypothetical protein|nr:DUF6567 family protein [uncultured Pedobacter sp.]